MARKPTVGELSTYVTLNRKQVEDTEEGEVWTVQSFGFAYARIEPSRSMRMVDDIQPDETLGSPTHTITIRRREHIDEFVFINAMIRCLDGSTRIDTYRVISFDQIDRGYMAIECQLTGRQYQ